MEFDIYNHTGQLLLIHPSSNSTNVFAISAGFQKVVLPMATVEMWRMKRDGTNNYTDSVTISNSAIVTVHRITPFPQYATLVSYPSTVDAETQVLFWAGFAVPVVIGLPLIVVRWFRRLSHGDTT